MIIGPMYLNAVSAMGVGIIKPWKIVSDDEDGDDDDDDDDGV